jgi:phosphatidylinositol alpha-1,6-mannosyltransferase
MLSLLDASAPLVAGRSAAISRGDKLRFVVRCLAETAARGHFIYGAAGVAGAHLRLGLRKLRPFAVWMHGVEVWRRLSRGNLQVLRAADRLLVNSHYTLRIHQELHGPADQARVCWLGTEEDDEADRRAHFNGRPTALILSRLDQEDTYKGHQELIKAWSEVTKAVPDAQLVIAGGGPGLKAMQELVHKSSVRANINVMGFVPENEMPRLWEQAHVFAMPSRGEGFGLVYVEAMRYGVPIIASTHDAASEVNLHGQTGFNVDLDRKADLSERLIQVLRSADLCQTMGEAGVERWRQHFRWSKFRDRFQPWLEEFVANA